MNTQIIIIIIIENRLGYPVDFCFKFKILLSLFVIIFYSIIYKELLRKSGYNRKITIKNKEVAILDIGRINVNNSVSKVDANPGLSDKIIRIDEVKKIKIENQEVTSDVKVSANELKSAVDIANKVLFKNNTHLQFRIHERTKGVMVKIIDDNSGEVLKEIPPEKMLDMVAKLWEIAGILIDEKR